MVKIEDRREKTKFEIVVEKIESVIRSLGYSVEVLEPCYDQVEFKVYSRWLKRYEGFFRKRLTHQPCESFVQWYGDKEKGLELAGILEKNLDHEVRLIYERKPERSSTCGYGIY